MFYVNEENWSRVHARLIKLGYITADMDILDNDYGKIVEACTDNDNISLSVMCHSKARIITVMNIFDLDKIAEDSFDDNPNKDLLIKHYNNIAHIKDRR